MKRNWTKAALCLAVVGIAIAAAMLPIGYLMENPLACVGVGLVGLGLCKEGRQRLARVS